MYVSIRIEAWQPVMRIWTSFPRWGSVHNFVNFCWRWFLKAFHIISKGWLWFIRYALSSPSCLIDTIKISLACLVISIIYIYIYPVIIRFTMVYHSGTSMNMSYFEWISFRKPNHDEVTQPYHVKHICHIMSLYMVHQYTLFWGWSQRFPGVKKQQRLWLFNIAMEKPIVNLTF